MIGKRYGSGLRRDYLTWVLLLIAFATIWVLTRFQLAVVFLLAALGIVYVLDSIIPFATALALLCFSPLFLLLGQDKTAEFFSLWAYYFGVVGVFMQFARYLRTTGKDTREKSVPGQED